MHQSNLITGCAGLHAPWGLPQCIPKFKTKLHRSSDKANTREFLKIEVSTIEALADQKLKSRIEFASSPCPVQPGNAKLRHSSMC